MFHSKLDMHEKNRTITRSIIEFIIHIKEFILRFVEIAIIWKINIKGKFEGYFELENSDLSLLFQCILRSIRARLYIYFKKKTMYVFLFVTMYEKKIFHLCPFHSRIKNVLTISRLIPPRFYFIFTPEKFFFLYSMWLEETISVCDNIKNKS